MSLWEVLLGGGLSIAGGIGAAYYQERRAVRLARALRDADDRDRALRELRRLLGTLNMSLLGALVG